MGLALIQAVNWHTKRPEKYVRSGGYVADGDYYLLNTNRMVDIKDSPTGGTIFKYNQAPNDHRASPDTIETNSSVAALALDADLVYQNKLATLGIFPTLDISKVTTDTPVDTEIEWDDIAMAYATPRDVTLAVVHLVYYDKSWKRRTAIVDVASLVALYALQT